MPTTKPLKNSLQKLKTEFDTLRKGKESLLIMVDDAEVAEAVGGPAGGGTAPSRPSDAELSLHDQHRRHPSLPRRDGRSCGCAASTDHQNVALHCVCHVVPLRRVLLSPRDTDLGRVLLGEENPHTLPPNPVAQVNRAVLAFGVHEGGRQLHLAIDHLDDDGFRPVLIVRGREVLAVVATTALGTQQRCFAGLGTVPLRKVRRKRA